MHNLVDFEKLKASVTIEQIVLMLNIRLKKEGAQLKGQCPICSSGGFVVTPSRNVFICFGNCKNRGSIIDLVAQVKGIRPAQAAQDIAQHFGAEHRLPTDRSPDRSPGPAKAAAFDADKWAASLNADDPRLEPLSISPQMLRDVWRGGVASNTSTQKHRLSLPLSRAGKIIGYFGIALDEKTQPRFAFYKDHDPAEFIFGEHLVQSGPLQLLRDPLDVVRASEVGMVAVCFLTENISRAQIEQLAVMMHERGCDSLEIL